MNVLEKILEEIEELKRNQDSKNQDFVTGYISALSTVEGVIAGLDEAKDINVPSNVGWISVEERLPEKTDYYLVQLSRKLPNEDYSDRVVVLFNGEGKEFECYANLIIAWQPLPERYKGGDDRA